MDDPCVFRSDGTVEVLVDEGYVISLYQAIRAAGLIVSAPIEPNAARLLADYGIEAQETQRCLVVTDPEHRIADILARWRRQRA